MGRRDRRSSERARARAAPGIGRGRHRLAADHRHPLRHLEQADVEPERRSVDADPAREGAGARLTRYQSAGETRPWRGAGDRRGAWRGARRQSGGPLRPEAGLSRPSGVDPAGLRARPADGDRIDRACAARLRPQSGPRHADARCRRGDLRAARHVEGFVHGRDGLMRICVFGAGAIGGNFAARLAAAGNEVSVVARGAHLEAIRAKGLTLIAGDKKIVAKVRASDKPSELGRQDAVISTLKATGLAALAESVGPLLGPDTPVVFAQNGIPWWYGHGLAKSRPPAPDLSRLAPGGALAKAVGLHRTLGGAITSPNHVVEPGVVVHEQP